MTDSVRPPSSPAGSAQVSDTLIRLYVQKQQPKTHKPSVAWSPNRKVSIVVPFPTSLPCQLMFTSDISMLHQEGYHSLVRLLFSVHTK